MLTLKTNYDVASSKIKYSRRRFGKHVLLDSKRSILSFKSPLLVVSVLM